MPQITANQVSNNRDTIVIYHAHCMDGMGAAYAASTVLGGRADYLPAAYDDLLPPIDIFKLKTVYIVDFSYPAAFIREIGLVAASVTVIDHHKTAEKDLVGQVFPKGVEVYFDMKRSGAGMTWDFFQKGTPREVLINYIEDRDLWTWKLPHSREVSAYISLFPIAPAAYMILARELENHHKFDEIVVSGGLLLKQQDRFTSKICKLAFSRILPSPTGPKLVMFANTSMLASEVGNSLLEKNSSVDFVAMWFDKTDNADSGITRVWSLRANNKFDCSALAKKFGGGGHPNAAGFTSSTNFMITEVP
jgi:hypothetical protein